MDDYRKLLTQSDSSVRSDFDFDPRTQLALLHGRRVVEPFNGSVPSSNTQIDPSLYTDIPTGSHSDESIVQGTPHTHLVKRYVVMDTSQRDWIKQPNPYSALSFSFGKQPESASNPPVYANNSFVPTFAVEQSNLPSPIPGIPNLQGWSLAASPSNIQYPPYNSSLPKGTFIGYDTSYLIQPSGSGFDSVFTPCNVASIRLVRAVLPQRQFLSLPIVPSATSTDDAVISSNIQSNLADKPYSTFSTYPYLLFYLNEYFGQYVGGNEPIRRSFSVMTQKQRTQTNFQTTVGVQQYDYEPWGEEALKFQSPLTNLQKLALTVADPVGNVFSHTDTLSVALIQATPSGMYLKCFTGSFSYFSGNELRVGDRIVFYSNTITNMLKSPVLAALDPQKKFFVSALLGSTFPVLELLDYVPDSNGIYNPRDSNQQRTTPYLSSYNGFLIPNFVTADVGGNITPTYPTSIDPISGTILEPNTLVGSNMPMLNTTLQPVYTLELDILQPDTSKIGGSIVL
jgi:hypothetical protein